MPNDDVTYSDDDTSRDQASAATLDFDDENEVENDGRAEIIKAGNRCARGGLTPLPLGKIPETFNFYVRTAVDWPKICAPLNFSPCTPLAGKDTIFKILLKLLGIILKPYK